MRIGRTLDAFCRLMFGAPAAPAPPPSADEMGETAYGLFALGLDSVDIAAAMQLREREVMPLLAARRERARATA